MGIPTKPARDGVYTLYENLIQMEWDPDDFLVYERELTSGKDGSVLMDVVLLLPKDGGPAEVVQRGFEEKFANGDLKGYSREELGLVNWEDRYSVLKPKNDAELIRAVGALAHYQDQLSQLPASEDLKRLVRFHEGVVAKFMLWYEAVKLKLPVGLPHFVKPAESMIAVYLSDLQMLPEAFAQLSEVATYRLAAMKHLREHHGRLKVTPRTLHNLTPNLKQEVRDFLNLKLGNSLKAKQIIDEVLKKPKKSKKREGLPVIDGTPWKGMI